MKSKIKLFDVLSDHGRDGNCGQDEFLLPDENADMLKGANSVERDWGKPEIEIEPVGRSCHFLAIVGGDGFVVHEDAVDKSVPAWSNVEFLILNCAKSELQKLQSPFNRGRWFAIKPLAEVPLSESANVKYFKGKGVVNRVISEVGKYVFDANDVQDLGLFRVRYLPFSWCATERFVDFYKERKLSGLRFVDLKASCH